MKAYYKIVSNRRGILGSAIVSPHNDLFLTYEEDKETTPLKGPVFVYPTLEKALEYLDTVDSVLYSYEVWSCLGQQIVTPNLVRSMQAVYGCPLPGSVFLESCTLQTLQKRKSTWAKG